MMRLIRALDILLSLDFLEHEVAQRNRRQKLSLRLHQVFAMDAIAASLDCAVRPILRSEGSKK